MDPSQLTAGSYELRIMKSSGVGGYTDTSKRKTVFFYETPSYGNVTPSYAAFGQNVSLSMLSLRPFDAVAAVAQSAVKLRFVTPIEGSTTSSCTDGATNCIGVAMDVPAVVESSNGSLPLQLLFDVPMPLVGGNLLTNASQVASS